MNVCVKRIGLPDKFVEHGPVEVLRAKYGLDRDGILKTARPSLKLQTNRLFTSRQDDLCDFLET
jgi:1-deoxy-D-xylulose-5-phosphate synthase